MDWTTGVSIASMLEGYAGRIVDASEVRDGAFATGAIKEFINKVIPEGLLFRGIAQVREEYITKSWFPGSGNYTDTVGFLGQVLDVRQIKKIMEGEQEYSLVRYKIHHTHTEMSHFTRATSFAGDLGLGLGSIFLAEALGLSIYNTYSFEFSDGKVVGFYLVKNNKINKLPYDERSHFGDDSYLVVVVPKWI